MEFPNAELYKRLAHLSERASIYITKERVTRNYESILGTGIFSSRSVVKYNFLKPDVVDKLGIIKQVNLNICNAIPQVKLSGNANYINDYYWLLLNTKDVDRWPKASDVFKRRRSIVYNPQYKSLNVIDCWNTARERMENSKHKYAKIWNKILNSRFMFEIIMHAVDMNPYVEGAFETFIDDPCMKTLYLNELETISFMFTPLCMYHPNDSDMKTAKLMNTKFWDYNGFTWLFHIFNEKDNQTVIAKYKQYYPEQVAKADDEDEAEEVEEEIEEEETEEEAAEEVD